MDEGEIPDFKSVDEECLYWKMKAQELKQDLLEYQDSSSQIEKELEKLLEQSERGNLGLRDKCNRLTLELDLCRGKLEQTCSYYNKELSELQKEVSDLKKKDEKSMKHIRDLEQKNDDLERSERVMVESLRNIEAKLNCAIERNALLESELEEKEKLKAAAQRITDEHRDLQEELNRRKRHAMPDNDKYREYTRSPIHSNKLSPESQSTATSKRRVDLLQSVLCVGDDGDESVEEPSFIRQRRNSPSRSNMRQQKRGKENIFKNFFSIIKKVSPSVGQLSSPNRISAINLVGDLLKKVGSLESKLAASKASRDINESPIRDLYRARNQRINHGTSSPTFQNNVVKM